MLFDSHAHLDLEAFDADRDEVLRRAAAAGVGRILCPIDIANPASIGTILDLAGAGAGVSEASPAPRPAVFAAAGLHPHQASTFGAAALDAIRGLASRGLIRAVGEIGLDFHYRLAPPAEQETAFRAQLALALELGLPAIVHSRLAAAAVGAAIRGERFDAGGVLHCFTEDWPFAAAMIEAGFHVSFSGIVTFANAVAVRDAARRVPLDRLLIETDAPYLAPVPHRGLRNEPAFVADTARALAALRGDRFESLAEATTANARALFRV